MNKGGNTATTHKLLQVGDREEELSFAKELRKKG